MKAMMTKDQSSSDGGRDVPQLSVVIVGCDGLQSLGPILHCLAGQTIARDIEVIAVLPERRYQRDVMAPWEKHFGTVHAVSVPAVRNRGRAAAAGVRAARAPIVAFTENHCFPDPDWAEILCRAHNETYAGVAPVVLNANPESSLSWAIHSAGYAAFSERDAAEEIFEMPLHNTSYRRDLLAALDNELEDLLSHESRLQKRLRDAGNRFIIEPSAKTRHINEATLYLVLGLNFFNGHRYGSRRRLGWGWPRRAAYAALFPFLSINVTREALRRFSTCRDRPILSVGLLLTIWLQSLAHAAGEAVGYVGRRREEFDFVDQEEFMILERLGGRSLTDPRIAGFVSHAVPLETTV